MRERIEKLAYFLHIYDGQGQLDLEDIAFMLVVGKLVLAPGIDWAAVCAMIPVIAAQMHVRSIDSKKN